MRIKIEISKYFMPEMKWPGEIVNGDAEAWIVDPEIIVSKETIPPSCKIIITASTGLNHIDFNYCKEKDIEVYSLLDDRKGLEEIKASSEFTFFLVLSALRRLNRLSHGLFSKRWYRDENSLRGNELCGKVVGIVGFGRIGRNLYKYCTAFGADVKYRHDPPAGAGHTLEDVFYNSDIVIISCSLNKQTVDMIGKNLILNMKNGACVVNTARGEIVRENELVEALNARPDITYATDVLSDMTAGITYSPLFELNNVIITPHVAGLTVESNTKAMLIANKLLWKWHEHIEKESL